MHGRDKARRRPPASVVDSAVDSAGAYKLLNTTLVGILAQPEAVAPYMGMLAGIEDMVAARAGAIYHLPAGSARAKLIASTGDMSGYSAAIQDFARALQRSAPVPDLWFDDCEKPDLLIKAIPVGGEEAYAILVLTCDDAPALRAKQGALLEALVDGLAAIFRASRQAQVNRRRDLQKERASISRELHDSLAQSLTYLKIQASRMQSMLRQEQPGTAYDRSEVELVLHELRDNLNIAYRQLRELMTTFRLTMNGEDFSRAIEDSIGEFEKRSRIAFDLDNRLSGDELTVDEEMQVLHIVREALSNIVRHAHARRAKVALRHCDDHSVQVTVNDDGVGIDESQRRAQHLGLIIMQERSRNLGGEFSVGQQHGGGTEIRVTFRPQKRSAETYQPSRPSPSA